MTRRWRIVLTSSILVALFAPVALDRDGIPLSTYPMYARSRGRSVDLVTANGIDRSGERHRLGLEIVGGSDDPLIVAGELRSAIAGGSAPRRCSQISRRAAQRADDVVIVVVEVVTERHDTVERTAGRPSLLERTVHAQCEVER